jgi:hypothetical protein
MFSFKTLAVREVSKVAAGNLIYLLSRPEPKLALRIEHPRAAQGGESTYPAALIFLGEVNGRTMPIVDVAAAAYPCVDCGMGPEVMWDAPLQLLRQAQRPEVGHAVLVENRVGISSSYGAGDGGQRAYWDPYSGRPINPRPTEPSPTAIVTHWRLGALDPAGVFRQLVVYPDDYETLTAGEAPR